MNRPNALLIAYEFLGLKGYSRSRQTEGVWTGGGIDHNIAVNQRRQNPDMLFIVTADALFRKRVHEVLREATGVSHSQGCFRFCPQGAQRFLE